VNWYVTVIVFQLVCLVGIVAALPLIWAIETGRLDAHLDDIRGGRIVGTCVGLLVIATACGLVVGMVAS